MDVFSALAEPTRRDIVELLALNGQLSATDISNNFTVSPPAISQHLKVLRDTKLVQVEKRAQQRLYQLNPAKISELDSWVKKMTHLWEVRFDTLNEVLKKENTKNNKLKSRLR